VALTGNVSTLRARASGASGEPDPSDMSEQHPYRLNPPKRGRKQAQGDLTEKQASDQVYRRKKLANCKNVSITTARSTSSY
jgi:hypothetical protein